LQVLKNKTDYCLGTVFLELWKRTNNTLSYEWDVNSFESTEPDRPEFVGNMTVEVNGDYSRFT